MTYCVKFGNSTSNHMSVHSRSKIWSLVVIDPENDQNPSTTFGVILYTDTYEPICPASCVPSQRLGKPWKNFLSYSSPYKNLVTICHTVCVHHVHVGGLQEAGDARAPLLEWGPIWGCGWSLHTRPRITTPNSVSLGQTLRASVGSKSCGDSRVGGGWCLKKTPLPV